MKQLIFVILMVESERKKENEILQGKTYQLQLKRINNRKAMHVVNFRNVTTDMVSCLWRVYTVKIQFVKLSVNIPK